MLLLLDHALTRSDETMTFTYLSGRDYPIKTNEVIDSFLSRHHSRNFMNFYRLMPGVDYYHHASQYYFVDQRNGLPKPLRRPAFHAERIVRRIARRRRFPSGHDMYRGSQWMTLTRSSAEYISEFRRTCTGREYERYFQHSWGSDELYFQTVLLNSPEAVRCSGYEDLVPSPNENDVYLHYIDWSDDREGPAILESRDLESLLASSYLFARKFDEGRSSDLLDRLDAERRAGTGA